jgi:RNA-directed DNA polymerase
METGLVRIAEIARQNPKERFTALIHHINQETLIECHQMVSGSKASGVDQVTKQAYGENLEANIADLIGRMKRQAYKPQPVRRVYIPKEGSNKMRPLGIPSYEDKLVQKGLARILNTIYEQDSHPVLQASSIFIMTLIAMGGKKLVNQITMSGMYLYPVKSR